MHPQRAVTQRKKEWKKKDAQAMKATPHIK
jgi:hypothetical protein